METTLEVLTTRRSRKAHRHWPDEVKARMSTAVGFQAIVAE